MTQAIRIDQTRDSCEQLPVQPSRYKKVNNLIPSHLPKKIVKKSNINFNNSSDNLHLNRLPPASLANYIKN
jgi:hypothetical protein